MKGVFPLFRARNLLARINFRLFIAPFMRSCGRRSVLIRPAGIEGIKNISLGREVFVGESAILAATGRTGAACPELIVGNSCSLGRNNHIYATRSIVIEDGVLTAGNVYISDNAHAYEDPDTPIKCQPIKQLRNVRIGAGSWLGQNVCVVGASIGRGCVVGANSVVLTDLPDYCVAVGSPARVVRLYDPSLKEWVGATASISTRPHRTDSKEEE